MSQDKLLPCPFCNSYAEIVQFSDGWVVFCPHENKDCMIVETKKHLFRHEAIKKWNTRPNQGLVPLDEALKELDAEIRSEENCIEIEKLAGNIVKEERYRGIAIGLKIGRQICAKAGTPAARRVSAEELKKVISPHLTFLCGYLSGEVWSVAKQKQYEFTEDIIAQSLACHINEKKQ